MKITIYSKTPCSYCDMAEHVAQSFIQETSHTYEKKMLDVDFTMDELLEKVPTARTFPQVFIDDKNVGGYEQFKKLVEENKLEHN